MRRDSLKHERLVTSPSLRHCAHGSQRATFIQYRDQHHFKQQHNARGHERHGHLPNHDPPGAVSRARLNKFGGEHFGGCGDHQEQESPFAHVLFHLLSGGV